MAPATVERKLALAKHVILPDFRQTSMSGLKLVGKINGSGRWALSSSLHFFTALKSTSSNGLFLLDPVSISHSASNDLRVREG